MVAFNINPGESVHVGSVSFVWAFTVFSIFLLPLNNMYYINSFSSPTPNCSFGRLFLYGKCAA